MLHVYKDYSFTAPPFCFHFATIFGLQDLTKESLVGFPSVKVSWFIPRDFGDTKHYPLPTQEFIRITELNHCFQWQMRPVLQWAVPSWASGNPRQGAAVPTQSNSAVHTQGSCCSHIYIFSRVYGTRRSDKQYVRATIFGLMMPVGLHQHENITELHLEVTPSRRVMSFFGFDVAMITFLNKFDIPILAKNSC